MVYFYMPLPVNKEGKGPVPMEEAHEIIHEIWDVCAVTVVICRDEEMARRIVEFLNSTSDN